MINKVKNSIGFVYGCINIKYLLYLWQLLLKYLY
ncbi:hypothetical protein SAMN05443550_107119 [Pedobacter hartonius]|uniref:Uncharacterized protein n=1 Tax=Pedobacter hartonius TaxID=425514 RepID=A0A1H4FBP0_9SPHI|nr:hypothetical protein SAMN05443550_107119 [Pedobacter hartonius]